MKKILSLTLAAVLSLCLLLNFPTVSHADDVMPPATTQPSEPTEPTQPQPTEDGVEEAFVYDGRGQST